MEKEIKINVPNGYEIDKENSTFECIKLKPIVNKLPKTWEEYCTTHKRQYRESWPFAEAVSALCQLIQLRDCYNDGWIPDWTTTYEKYSIHLTNGVITVGINTCVSRILTFKTEAIRDEFLNNFEDLIEIAKPLL